MKNAPVISIGFAVLVLLVGVAATGKDGSRSCLKFDSLAATRIATTPEYCEVKRDNLCYDVVYNAKFTNTCERPIEVRWKFPHSTDPSYSSQTLAPNEVRRVSCRKRLQRCDGRIHYNSRFAD